MIFPNIRTRPLNKTSVPNSFKSLSKEVDQKVSTQNVNMKKDENNYFRAELRQKQEEILTLTERITDRLLIIEKIYVSFNVSSYKNKFPNRYMSYEKLAIIFDIKHIEFILNAKTYYRRCMYIKLQKKNIRQLIAEVQVKYHFRKYCFENIQNMSPQYSIITKN